VAGRRQSIHVEDCGRIRRTVGRDAVTLQGSYGVVKVEMQVSRLLNLVLDKACVVVNLNFVEMLHG
jgi:hypothetical protein